jgi:hypothetical protein
VIKVLFWIGVVTAIREWYRARKDGVPITRMERWCLGLAVALALLVRLIADLGGMPPQTVTAAFQLSLSVGVFVWAVRRMVVRRTALHRMAKSLP